MPDFSQKESCHWFEWTTVLFWGHPFEYGFKTQNRLNTFHNCLVCYVSIIVLDLSMYKMQYLPKTVNDLLNNVGPISLWAHSITTICACSASFFIIFWNNKPESYFFTAVGNQQFQISSQSSFHTNPYCLLTLFSCFKGLIQSLLFSIKLLWLSIWMNDLWLTCANISQCDSYVPFE